MECRYCGLCSPPQPWSHTKGYLHYCDYDCCSAKEREDSKANLEQVTEDTLVSLQEMKLIKPAEDGIDIHAKCIKTLQLRYLFCKGLLQRQTTKQLTLLHSKMIEADQSFFLAVDEEREDYTDGQLLCLADLCSKKQQNTNLNLIEIWGR